MLLPLQLRVVFQPQPVEVIERGFLATSWWSCGLDSSYLDYFIDREKGS
jgi:hypothetical protein